MDMSWYFPKLNGGVERGLNDSGIEMFRNKDALGRETCQNIGDARPTGSELPAIATFERRDIKRSDVPGIDGLKETFSSCRNHLLENLKDGTGNETMFFDIAERLLDGDTIPFLRIGDENTTGLSGSDDEKQKPFWRLIRGQGSSSLQGAGGGTFGIGQHAPFAYSNLRTIFYSTKTAEGDAFVGKSILASHPGVTDNIMRQPQGWWCIEPSNPEQGNWTTQRQPESIPPMFRRSVVGTDLWLAGFEMEDWEQRIRHSVLRNFFSAIGSGRLILRLAENGKSITEINKDNLANQLETALAEAKKENPSKNSWQKGIGSSVYYHKALTQPDNEKPFTRNIPNLGEVRFYIYRDEESADIPNRYCTMRTPGIIVYEKGSTIVRGFAGVLVCDNDDGNKYLSQLEGPKHDDWSIDSVRSWTPAEKNQGKATLKQIRAFISDSLKELRGADMHEMQDIPDLGKFLPAEEDDETPAKAAAGTKTEEQPQEKETGRQVAKGILIKLPPKKAIPKPPSGPPVEDGGVTAPGSGDGEPGDETGTGTTKSDGGTKGSGSANKPVQRAALRFRSFRNGDDYRLIITALSDIDGTLPLRAVGEDISYPISLQSATDVNSGIQLKVSGSDIPDIRLSKDQRLILDVKLDEADTVCLTAGV